MDHTLVMCRWIWRVRNIRSSPRINWSLLNDEAGPISTNQEFIALAHQTLRGDTKDCHPKSGDILMTCPPNAIVPTGSTESSTLTSENTEVPTSAAHHNNHTKEPLRGDTRACYLKNGTSPMTCPPNVKDLVRSERKVCDQLNQTKQLKVENGMVAEGRIAQYYQCPVSSRKQC